MSEVSNSDDIISLDALRERIAELEGEEASLQEDVESAESELDYEPDNETLGESLTTAREALAAWTAEHGTEKEMLVAFESDVSGYGDTAIRDSYFQTYARELAEDVCGDEMRAASWPLSCIDWEQAATELQSDYSCVEFDGVDYWVR